MSQSYWMKSQDGSYSNNKVDTFDPGKKYAGVRLQAGVLPLDRDWNELEDIRRYEEVMLRKWYIGNGTPDDGFKISPVEGSNDFSISPGRCLIDGFEVVNDSQILYSKQKDVPALTAPSGKRSDTVYIDLWIREISGSEDPTLLNPQDLGRETCRRHKIEWRVRVDEGRGEGDTGHSPTEEFHHYYDIARINRDGAQATISDLRRTGLASYLLKDSLSALGALSTELNGLKSSLDALEISQNDLKGSVDDLKGSLNIIKDKLTAGKIADGLHSHSRLAGSGGSPDPALSADNSGNIWIKGNIGIGTTQSGNFRLSIPGKADTWMNALQIASDMSLLGQNKLNLMKFGSDRDYQVLHKSSGAFGRNTLALHCQAEDAVGIYSTGWTPLLEVKGGAGDVYVKGNVSIGTVQPKRTLHVEGSEVHSGNANGGFAGFSFANRDGPNNGAFVDNGGNPPGQRWVWYARSRFAALWSGADKLIISPDGDVGIGTLDLHRRLHVDGSEVHSGNANGGFAGYSFANRDGPNNGAFVENGGNPPGQRWVLYSHGRTAALWSGSDRVLVSPDGVVSASKFSSGFVSEAKYKTNIQPLTDTLDKLEKIRGVSFEWNDSDPFGRLGKGREIGLIANEVEAVFPELVITWGSENYKGIDYDRLTGVLVEAVKELKAENEASDREIEELKACNRASDQEIKELKEAMVRITGLDI